MAHSSSTAAKPVLIKHVAVRMPVRTLFVQTASWFSDNSLRIAIAFGIGAILVALLLTGRRFAQRLCPEGQAAITWRTVIGRVAQKTSAWFLIILAANLVDDYADAPPLVDKTVGFLFTVALTFQAAIWAREIAIGFIEYRAGLTDQDHSALTSALGIVRFLVSFALFAVATILVLGNLGVDVTSLVAGLGVGGIAIGLAAQGIFKDLFAALAIIFDRPFRKGDSVKWNNVSGSVEAIGLKTTRIRVMTGEQMIVSNAHLLEKEMFNLARLDRRRITLDIGIVQTTPADMAERVPGLLREIVEAVPKCHLVRTGMVAFGDSSLDFQLQFDVLSSIYDEVFAARSKVALSILRRFNEEGIDFAFPTRTVITAGPDGKPVPPYPPVRLIGDQPLAGGSPRPNQGLEPGADGEPPHDTRAETAP